MRCTPPLLLDTISCVTTGMGHIVAMNIQWAQPWLAMAGLLAVVPIMLAVAAARKGRRIGKLSAAAQCLAVLLVAGALAQPSAPIGRRANLPWMIVRDVSASTTGQADPLAAWPRDLPREDFSFAQNIQRAQIASTQPASASSSPFADESNLAPALRLAAATAAQHAGLVLASDGQWPDDWPPAAAALAQAGVKIAIVPLDSPPADGRLAALTAQRKADGTVALTVTASANAPMRRRLTVSRDGLASPLMDRELTLLDLAPATFHLNDAPPADRLATYRASLDAGDPFPQNDSLTATVLPLRTRIALVAGGELAATSATLAGRLPSVQVVAPANAPQSPAGWMEYSAVILIDAHGDLLSPASRAALASYVRDGGGLVHVGAGLAMDPADRDDPLNRVAALLANPYQRRPLHVTVVLDASGSMAELTGATGPAKFDLARQAVLSLQRHLTARDSLAVITYAQTPRKVYDSGSAPADFTKLADALAAVRPAGSTQVMPALELAAGEPPAPGQDGLVVLVSDLLTEPHKPADVQRVEQLFVKNNLKLSIVATGPTDTGPHEATSLEVLTGRLHAQLVRRDGLAGLAEIFVQFLHQARGEAIAHGRFDATITPDAMGLANFRLPTLDAYILAGAQESADVLARVGGDPLLARRQVGLGRSVTLAVPLDYGGNAALAGGKELADLLAACVHWAQRTGDDSRFTGSIARQAGRWTLTLDARDETGPMNNLKLSAEIQTSPQADASPLSVALVQIAPGRYQGTFDAAGPAGLAVRDADGRILWRQSLDAPYGAEFAAIGANWDNLHRLADMTGGQIIRPADLPHLSQSLAAQREQPLWPVLLGLALLIMLTDWLTGRVLRT